MARYRSRITAQQASNQAAHALANGDSLEDRFAMLEREEQIESLLLELKSNPELKENQHALPDHTA